MTFRTILHTNLVTASWFEKQRMLSTIAVLLSLHFDFWKMRIDFDFFTERVNSNFSKFFCSRREIGNGNNEVMWLAKWNGAARQSIFGLDTRRHTTALLNFKNPLHSHIRFEKSPFTDFKVRYFQFVCPDHVRFLVHHIFRYRRTRVADKGEPSRFSVLLTSYLDLSKTIYSEIFDRPSQLYTFQQVNLRTCP